MSDIPTGQPPAEGPAPADPAAAAPVIGAPPIGEPPMERTVLAQGRLRSWSATHMGTVRDHNEDRCVNRPDLGLFAVADGAGGHQNGQAASGCVAARLDAVPTGLAPAAMVQDVKERLRQCHHALRAQASLLHEGAMIATTVVVLLLVEDYFACLWAGDSRIYLLRGGRMVRLTRDHSLVQELVDAGLVAEADAERHPRANIITRAIGAEGAEVEIDMATDRLFPGDRFLLCSDGLTKCVPEAEIAAVLGADDDAPAERLVLAALARHATDNVTAVTVEVLATPDEEDPTLGPGQGGAPEPVPE